MSVLAPAMDLCRRLRGALDAGRTPANSDVRRAHGLRRRTRCDAWRGASKGVRTGFMFIVNPAARGGRTRTKLEELRSELNRQGIYYDVRLSESLDHATRLSREANLAGYHTVVAVGGDGTINRVLNGFFDADGNRLSAAQLAAIHIGTSPDFCRSYGVPTRISDAVAALRSGVSRPIFAGQILYQHKWRSDPGDYPSTRFFGCCANAGIGASLARLANDGIRQRVGDTAGTLVSLLRVLRSFRPVDLELELDGETRTFQRVYNVAIGRTRYIASGIQIRHRLEPNDRRFYLVFLREFPVRYLFGVLWSLYSGRPLGASPFLTVEYARTITVRPSSGPVELEFDGDPAGWCPAHVCVGAQTINLVVPNAHVD
jgi:diacylglycerol kinase (ATP)